MMTSFKDPNETRYHQLITSHPRSVRAPQREVEDPLGCRQVGLFPRSSGFEELLCRFHGGLFLQDLWIPHGPWSSAGEARCCTPAAAGWSYVLRRCGWESGRGSIRPPVSRVVDSFKMPSKMIKSLSNHRLSTPHPWHTRAHPSSSFSIRWHCIVNLCQIKFRGAQAILVRVAGARHSALPRHSLSTSTGQKFPNRGESPSL